ncbi:Predicted dithiol-disulfide isomerase, DsbA family [Poseidonocella pacifica]|uniref:Predicted dithiol-disulfide isomerase, DsbA family n=1 Tax=Poseidonocella pacifica TaxID=871651 RepID=A0A1I0V2L4_9RHOB|nr:DsbA family oxidoreductase [Poseidonocella pacifica]SFA70363.1 Predicted dithiol-disulfide isomerase, DsbA family [Poseidonocella pacifica]
MTQTPLRIDIISDVMCPWCIIGFRQLERALDSEGVAHEIHWHPFELNPEMAPEGQNMREHIAEKYGATPEQSAQNRAQMTTLGTDLGIDFRFSGDMRMHNSFAAHQLLHWAGEQGRKHDLELALFTAHFTNNRDLSNTEVLLDIAAETGLDRNEAQAVLADGRFADVVREHEHFWLQQGVRGVPAIVFAGQHLVTGAQGSDTYASILRQLTEKDA